VNDTGRDEHPGPVLRPPVVASKVAVPPPRDRVVARPRLDPLLAPPGRCVTLVVANAGWGKTSAVHDRVTRTRSRVAWLTLDRSDDEPTRFWSQVLYATSTVAPTVASGAARTLFESEGGTDGFVGALVNDLARLDVDVTLVIDDVHVLDDAHVLERLAYLVEHAPPQLSVVLAGRERPRLPTARWRARGLTREVSERDLAFSAEEAAAFLTTFDGIAPTDETVAALTAQTEGWPMGLQLAALSLQRRSGADPALAVEVGVARAARFLIHEVVRREPGELRDFLYATSVVEILNAELADALTGRHGATATLRTLEDRRLFVVALDNRREWFRYHHLFREALLDELAVRDEPRLRRLHAVAARWFAAAGDIRLAVGHLLAAGENDEAFELAVRSTPRAGLSRRHQDWLGLVPLDDVAGDPERMARFALALGLRQSYVEGEVWLTRAEEASRSRSDLPPGFAQRLVALRGQLYALRGDARRALDKVAELGPVGDAATTDPAFERLPVIMARAHLLLGDVTAARALVEPLASGSRISAPLALVVVPAVQATIAVAEGKLGEGLALATLALRRARPGTPDFGALDALLARATVFIERDQPGAAQADLAELEPLADDFDSIVHATLGALSLARLALARDDVVGATAGVARARHRALRSGGDVLPGRVDALEALVCIRRGDLSRASALTAQLPLGVERTFLEIRLDLERRPSVARARLGELRVSTVRDRIVRQLLLARASSNAVAAERHRTSAATLAQPEGFALVFAEEDAPVPARAGDAPAHDALSERELAVLRQLGTPASNSGIARELFISSNTLKTHLRSIYRKLGVASREQAVERARARGLL